ncbi:MFS general substrate transporter [Venustampulla echinocandica]|uniref:MFS general substrate transporter n=1 Tax=Venustampulla echinocandica TaxID=2656787 RepID=A0A370TSF6_9HELO|nr:MFS general substrate transporter [Venustampulla echinocandica]RDL38461.1 MFS general substrate transporter [Venustampulla echinocandica]
MAIMSPNVYLWYVCLVASATMILYGYDAATFNAVQGSANFIEYFHKPDANVIGSVNTAYTVGGIVSGVFFSAPISNMWGRKMAIVVGCVIVIIATFVSTFTPRNIGGYIGGRALVGIGQGIALGSGPVYISDWDWKTVMLCQLIAPVFIIANIWACPESPRWFIKKDRTEDAIKALRMIREDDDMVELELQEIRQAIAFENQAVAGSYKPLWTDKTVRYRFILAVILNVAQQLSGQGSLNNYSTIIYKTVFKDNSTIQLINALNGTFGITFTLNATWTVDRFGRRFLLLVGAVGMAAYKPSWGATVWIWTSEIFSMNVRAQGVAMAAQSQNVANAVLQQIFPLFLEKKGFYAMYMFAGINCFLVIFVYFWIPETKGKTLETMDTLFGSVNHVDKGAVLMDEQEEGKRRQEGNQEQEVEEGQEVVDSVENVADQTNKEVKA